MRLWRCWLPVRCSLRVQLSLLVLALTPRVFVACRAAAAAFACGQVSEEATKEHPFGHALVAGIDRAPLKVTKSMGQKRILKRSRVKPFIKVVNFSHLMPTRYTVTDIELKNIVKSDVLKKQDTREQARKELKKTFEDRYLNRGKNTGGVQYFFSKLRF